MSGYGGCPILPRSWERGYSGNEPALGSGIVHPPTLSKRARKDGAPGTGREIQDRTQVNEWLTAPLISPGLLNPDLLCSWFHPVGYRERLFEGDPCLSILLQRLLRAP